MSEKRVGTFLELLIAMATLAIMGIGVCVAGYETIGTMMVRVAIVVDIGAIMVVGLRKLRRDKTEQ